MKSLKIAIVGAGVAGLSAAAFLHQSGHDVTIFEEFRAPSPLGAGLLLQPTGLAVLSMLGLDTEIIEQGSRINQLYGRAAHSSRTVLDVRYNDFKPGLFGVGTHRGTLFSLLYKHVIDLGVSIRTGEKISSVESGYLISSSDARTEQFDLVVDASGANSSLRNQYAEIAFNRVYPFGALWATVAMPETGLLDDQLEQRYQKACNMVGVLLVGSHEGKKRAAFFWSIKRDDYDLWRREPIEKWKLAVRRLWPEIGEVVDQFTDHEDLAFATYRDVKLNQTSTKKIVFIGDAAHCTSPQLGQGANLALVDSMVLSKCLSESNTLEAGISQFSNARKNHILFYQTASRWLTPFFQSESWIFSKMRFFTCDVMCYIKPARFVAAQVLTGTKTGPFTSLNPGDWASEYDTRR